MSNFQEYLEMAYRVGESYSGHSLLVDSQLGNWIYKSGIRNKDIFHFTRQSVYFHKTFNDVRIAVSAVISKALDPGFMKKVKKALNDADPKILNEADRPNRKVDIIHGTLRLPYEGRNALTIKKIKNILDKAKIKYNFEKLPYGTDLFEFPTEISFKDIRMSVRKYTPNEEQDTYAYNAVPYKKRMSDADFTKLLSTLHNAKTSADKQIPEEIRQALRNISGIKAVK